MSKSVHLLIICCYLTNAPYFMLKSTLSGPGQLLTTKTTLKIVKNAFYLL